MKANIGQRYGRLTLLRLANYKEKTKLNENQKNKKEYGYFMCDCGTRIFKRLDNVLYGHTSSCGCLGKETVRNNLSKGRVKNIVHSKPRTPVTIERLKRLKYKNNISEVFNDSLLSLDEYADSIINYIDKLEGEK